jgi:hypothetical protein
VSEAALPRGGVYQWHQRGLEPLRAGDPAAATLLARASDAGPHPRSILEALAPSLCDAGRYADAMTAFTALIGLNPTDDYVQFGLGPAASRSEELRPAAERLCLAVTMRSDLVHYARALRRVRALQVAKSACPLP